MSIEIYISDEDQSEIDSFVQLSRIEGGKELVEAIVNESVTEALSHVVDSTIDLNNKEAYVQILEENL